MGWDFRDKRNLRSWLGCEEEPQCIFVLPQFPVVDASESLQAAGALLHCRSQLDVQRSTVKKPKEAAGGPGGGQKSCVCVFAAQDPKARLPGLGTSLWGYTYCAQFCTSLGSLVEPRGSTHHKAVDVPLVLLTSSVK